MERVTGIGGVFFKARDPRALLDWYVRHLGVEPETGGEGVVFSWKRTGGPDRVGHLPRGDRVFRRARVALDDQLPRCPARPHARPTPSRGSAGRRADRGIAVRSVRVGHRPRGESLRAVGTAAGALSYGGL